MRRMLGSLVAILGLTTVVAPAAHADILAAVCVSGAGGSDISILNAATGVRRTLPAGVNTSEYEWSPSISSDGRRLVFRRGIQFPLPESRVIVTDLTTGQSADLFDAFELAADRVHLSSITPNGATVATGRRDLNVLGQFTPRVTLTSLASFPNGPFSRSSLSLSRRYPSRGLVESVAAGGNNLFALHVRPQGLLKGEIVLAQLGASSSAVVRSTPFSYSSPALAASNPTQVVFVERYHDDGKRLQGDLVFRPATLSGFAGSPTSLPSSVNTFSENEMLPALTSNGRYLGFVRNFRSDTTRNDRLFVWDTLTQTFLNPNGINLGIRESDFSCASASIYQETILTGAITQLGNVNATLQQASSIGIFVQRIVGKTKVFGRKAYELETVGRFPLGSFGEGNVFTNWDFTVNGEPLPPGKYLVTLRAVEDTDEGPVARELGEPQVLRIDKKGRAHVKRGDNR